MPRSTIASTTGSCISTSSRDAHGSPAVTFESRGEHLAPGCQLSLSAFSSIACHTRTSRIWPLADSLRLIDSRFAPAKFIFTQKWRTIQRHTLPSCRAPAYEAMSRTRLGACDKILLFKGLEFTRRLPSGSGQRATRGSAREPGVLQASLSKDAVRVGIG